MKKIFLLEDHPGMSEQIVKNLSVAIPKAEILTFACGNDFLAVLDNEANRDGIYIIDGQFPMESGASIDGNGPGIVKVIQEKFPNASVIGYSNRPQLFHDQKPPVIEKPVFGDAVGLADWVRKQCDKLNPVA